MKRPNKGRAKPFADELANHFERTSLWALIRYALSGAAAGIILVAAVAVVHRCIYLTRDDDAFHAVFVGAYFYAALLIPACILISTKAAIVRFLDSRRIDLAFAAAIGAGIGLTFHNLPSKYVNGAISQFNPTELIGLIILPPALLSIFLLSALLKIRKKPAALTNAAFFSDSELKSTDEDMLNVRPDAERFAERVLNGGSTESMVFGLDAPWGAGKSSFINFCEQWWKARPQQDVIVYRFNPLQYEDRKGLLSKFVDGLISTIREHVFLPELQSTVSQYAELFKGEKKFNLWGFDFTLGAPRISIESAHGEVSKVLSTLPKRLIVIVDDLDRMEFAALKDILFVVKKCFSFPNLSFVLCYDTQNIATLESGSFDSEKISEFLEKFVNVKQGLFPTAESLKRYLTEGRKLAAARNPLIDPTLLDQAVGGLVQIYSSAEYVQYLPLVGDVRKIKRLLNILVLLDIASTNFEIDDFDTLDLLHLLLIYINFPSLFRTIYNAETGDRNQFVSLKRQYDGSGGSHYVNSPGYTDFMKAFDAKPNERLLLTKLFSANRFTSTSTSNVSEEQKRTLACFNESFDGTPGNLQRYLQLIVSVSKPQSEDSFRTFMGYKNQLIAGTNISTFYSDPAFDPTLGEARYEQLWRAVTNNLEEFDAKRCASIIRDALHLLSRHSQLEERAARLGFRQTLVYLLLKLLDTGGWHDSEGWHTDNTNDNILGIAEWIYGEGTHETGIIDTLMDDSRGPLGLHDVLVFRLYSCADRAGTLFNLTRAVGLHSAPAAPTSGVLTEIVKPQMREMSQTIFRKFKAQYIEPRRNIFTLHRDLSGVELSGDFFPALQAAMARGELSSEAIDDMAALCASTCLSFSVYQLSNRLVSSGIGCGYYDEVGNKDEGGIHFAMNDYLFDVCFSGMTDDGGLLTFIDFALSQFRSDFGRRKNTYAPDLRELLKMFDAARLRIYWLANREHVKARLVTIDRIVKSYAYTANYQEDLPPLMKVLDDFANS